MRMTARHLARTTGLCVALFGVATASAPAFEAHPARLGDFGECFAWAESPAFTGAAHLGGGPLWAGPAVGAKCRYPLAGVPFR